MSDSLRKTSLYDRHVAHGARMVDFAGWSMPVQYTSIVAEHQATRQAATLFDISHMGRLTFSGPRAAAFLDHLATRRVDNMTAGRIRYSLLTNTEGGILDDVLIYAPLPTAGNGPSATSDPLWTMVVNAGNRDKIVGWIQQQLEAAYGSAAAANVDFHDVSEATAMLALQGPRAIEIGQSLFSDDVSLLKYFTGMISHVKNTQVIVSRTGYTGEDGLEIICDTNAAPELWEALFAAGAQQGLQPAGLGARDTLRLEAAMPLYGHELLESIDPFQAGLDFAVSLKGGRDFVGAAALRAIQQRGPQRVRVGLRLTGKRVPREHYRVLAQDTPVGEVTSGTFSPTLQCPLAMAYVTPAHANTGTSLSVDVRGRHEPAEVVTLPFYQRSS